MSDDGLLVCPCIVQARGLASTGPRSRVGSLLPRRNHAWLNAGPSGWVAFNADNGDVKLPFRVPIIPETHEASAGSAEACCKAKDELDLAYEVQMGQLLICRVFRRLQREDARNRQEGAGNDGGSHGAQNG